jgi:hypothetical protein
MLTTLEWRDPLMSSGYWIYRVTAVYADCRRGSTESGWTYPEPQTPKNVRAEQVGRDSVALAWDPVSGASYYTVTGTPNSTTLRSTVSHLAVPGVPVGAGTWQVTAVFQGQGGDGTPSLNGGSASASVTMVQRHYRLIAEALRVNAETADQQFSGDGKYDEVFVMGIAERFERSSGTPIDVSRVRVSAVHGDISYWPPPQRVKAGTASGNGGIQHGDIVTPIWSAPSATSPMGKPSFVLWEGELIGGTQDLLLHPMLMEVDEPDSYGTRAIPASYAICPGLPCTWSRYFSGPGQSSRSLPAVQAAIAAPQISVKEGVKMWLTGSGYFVHLENQNRDRPIGLEVESNAEKLVGLVGMWRDKVVVLSREKIEAALASGQNRVEVRFWEHWNLTNTPPTTVNYLNGDYTLVIRIERSPQPTVE